MCKGMQNSMKSAITNIGGLSLVLQCPLRGTSASIDIPVKETFARHLTFEAQPEGEILPPEMLAVGVTNRKSP